MLYPLHSRGHKHLHSFCPSWCLLLHKKKCRIFILASDGEANLPVSWPNEQSSTVLVTAKGMWKWQGEGGMQLNLLIKKRDKTQSSCTFFRSLCLRLISDPPSDHPQTSAPPLLSVTPSKNTVQVLPLLPPRVYLLCLDSKCRRASPRARVHSLSLGHPRHQLGPPGATTDSSGSYRGPPPEITAAAGYLNYPAASHPFRTKV